MVFVSNPFEPATLFQQQKRVARKYRSLLKFLTAQKDLVYGRQSRCRSKCVPPTSTQMTFPRGVRCHLPLKKAFLCWNFKCGKSSGGATKAVVGEADACDFSGCPLRSQNAYPQKTDRWDEAGQTTAIVGIPNKHSNIPLFCDFLIKEDETYLEISV